MPAQSVDILLKPLQRNVPCLSCSEIKRATEPPCPHPPRPKQQTMRFAKCFRPRQTCPSVCRRSFLAASLPPRPAHRERVADWRWRFSSPKDPATPSFLNSDRVSNRSEPKSQSCLLHTRSSCLARGVHPPPGFWDSRGLQKRIRRRARHSDSAG